MSCQDIDRLLRNAIAAGSLPGIVAGVTTREGTSFLGAYGGIDRPSRADDIFWIASMTKAITSVAAMQMVERGLVDLDEPLDRLLPEVRERQILEGFDADGRPRLRPATRAITLRQLLSHSSGAAENVWHADMLRYIEATGWPTGGSGKRQALDLPLVAEPGLGWQYGISHDLAGLLVDALTGMPLDRYFAEAIFGPVGMADTGYAVDAANAGRKAQLYARDASGALLESARSLPQSREYWPGGGALNSTAGDYLAFIRMLLNDGRAGDVQVLQPGTIERMAQSVTGELAVSRLVPAIPAMSNPVEMLPGIRKGWGLGFMVNLEDMPGRRRAGSLAWAGLSNSYYWIDRQSGVGGVLMTQLLPFADAEMLALFEAFERAVYAELAA